MNPTFPGLNHVTAITSLPQENVDFYCGVLGLRLVKRTVNFDDPTSYHLYYGDESGSPGTIMTFFAWPGAPRARVGPPQLTATAFAAPAGSLGFWAERLKQHGIDAQENQTRFGEELLSFADPDGIRIEIVGAAQPGGQAPTGGPVPAGHALRGFHGATLSEQGYENTARLLTEVMGFRADGSEGNRFRYRASGEFAAVVDLLCVPDARRGGMGPGVVHHVAFRTPDDEGQQAARGQFAGLGFNVSPVLDRNYFHSIYFHEPGGVLFEIATDPPGFTADEPFESLGTKLHLPPWLERDRAALEAVLPPLRVSAWNARGG